ncbi:MAG: SPFH domain-containing protein [Spirochaetes bacterium]|jgi:hypothetical protein|nr:SPFH domain-containing protein [Spirochaetota bacterium]
MKSFIKKIILFIFIAAAAYVCFFSIISLEPDRIGVVEDLRRQSVVKIFTKRYNFIWEASIPCWYDVYKVEKKRRLTVELKLPIPELDSLKNDQYTVRIPVSVIYSIDADKFFYQSYLAERGGELDDAVGKIARGGFSLTLNQYLGPVYRPDAFNNFDRITADSIEKIRADLKAIGVSCDRLILTGSVRYPKMNEYFEGINHKNELRKLEEKNEKDLKMLRSRLKMDKLENEEMFSKLNVLSKIIKNNPDILKYIYIDKISPNVKVILSSDGRVAPGMFDDEKYQPARKKTDVDNLK